MILDDNIIPCKKLAMTVITEAVKDLKHSDEDISKCARDFFFSNRYKKVRTFWFSIADIREEWIIRKIKEKYGMIA